MVAAMLIALREGLEAAFIIGIVIAVLRQIGRRDLEASVWWGVASAIVISVVAGLALYAAGAQMEGRTEEIFEGVAMLLAAGFLVWMIVWMQHHGSQIKDRLTADTESAAASGQRSGLFLLACLAVAREGFETVLFLTAVAMAGDVWSTALGALVGLLLAVSVGWLIFSASIRLDLRRFFQVTGALLIVVAAGLVAHGVHEFQEAGVLPVVVEHVWDTNALLDENGAVGMVAKAMFGYNGNPSLVEVLAYFAFLVLIAAILYLNRRGGASSATQP